MIAVWSSSDAGASGNDSGLRVTPQRHWPAFGSTAFAAAQCRTVVSRSRLAMYWSRKAPSLPCEVANHCLAPLGRTHDNSNCHTNAFRRFVGIAHCLHAAMDERRVVRAVVVRNIMELAFSHSSFEVAGTNSVMPSVTYRATDGIRP